MFRVYLIAADSRLRLGDERIDPVSPVKDGSGVLVLLRDFVELIDEFLVLRAERPDHLFVALDVVLQQLVVVLDLVVADLQPFELGEQFVEGGSFVSG